MIDELKGILREAYIRERKLNCLYGALSESNGDHPGDDFFARARDDQNGDLELLQEINRRYNNDDIDPNILERMGESLLQLRTSGVSPCDLLKKVLDYESELVEVYKSSLRYLTSDDQTRQQVNRLLTVKLVHKRDLRDKLQQL